MEKFRVIKRYGGNLVQTKQPCYNNSTPRKQNNGRQQTIEECCFPSPRSQTANMNSQGGFGKNCSRPQMQQTFSPRCVGRGSTPIHGYTQTIASKTEQNNMGIDEDLWNTDFDENWNTQPTRQIRASKRGPNNYQPRNIGFRQQNHSPVPSRSGSFIGMVPYGVQNSYFNAGSNNSQYVTEMTGFPNFDDFHQDIEEEVILNDRAPAEKKPGKEITNPSKYPKYSGSTRSDTRDNSPGPKPLDANFPRVFTVSVAKLQSWIENNPFAKGEILFELFGILDSVDKNTSQIKVQQFVLKGQQKGKINCTFYEMDRSLKLQNIGQWHRCVGILNNTFFQCLSFRSATTEELRVLDNVISVNSKAVAVFLRSKITI